MTHSEITATYLTERQRWPGTGTDSTDTIIGSVHAKSGCGFNNHFSVKGPAAVDALRVGCDYVFFGKWSDYKNRRTGKIEKQFHFTSFVMEEPASREAIIGYLTHHGEGIGIGLSRATKLYETFGQDAVRICREEPFRVADTMHGRLSVNLKQAEELSAALLANAAIEKTKLSLTSLLAGRGFIRNLASLAIQKWGVAACQIIRRDPYKLMAFKSCGFKRCDAMYFDLKLNPARLKRQALCAWYSIARNTDGSTWFSEAHPTSYLRSSIAGASLKTELALQLAARAKVLDVIYTNNNSICSKHESDKRWFAEHKNSQHEQQIADSIACSADEDNIWPDPSNIESIDDHQRGELIKATQTTIGILGGSPGTGKTWTVASLVELISETIGLDHILIGAPTGKAAVRVTENLQSRGIDLTARTWHSLLARVESDHHQGYFSAKFLIGDESSMIDTDLMSRIMRARAVGTHLLLVGDVNQLPPVGHGSPLRDLIQSGVSYGELREIKRNSGGIVETCAAIRDNPGKINWNVGGNLIFDRCYQPEKQREQAIKWIRKAQAEGLDPIWDCQVVVAVNEKSPLSRKELNKFLQDELNPTPAAGSSLANCPFRVNDKIVNTKNGYFETVGSLDGLHEDIEDLETNDKGEVYVANGELAKVVDVDGNKITAELSLPYRKIKFWLGKKNQNGQSDHSPTAEGSESSSEPNNKDESTSGCTFELGYALSVHKSQGSDWPVVIVMIDDFPGARQVCDRSWIYTAISRAKSRCVLIGKEQVANQMAKVSNIGKRKTFLRERILLLKSAEILAGV